MDDLFYTVMLFVLFWGDPDLYDLIIKALEKYTG